MSNVEKKPGGLPLPPLIYVAAIALSLIAHAIYPLPWISSPLSDILFAAGWLALLAVAALLYSAITTMKRAKTTMNPNATPDHLVTSGPFSITRNPMYLGNTLLMIGVGLIAGIVWFLVFAILAAFTTQKVSIESEEKKLTEKFGKRYHDYSRKVRRWI
jgi:protein-S-isoprenylcysteine O-methyltransferase Ste14